MISSPKKKNYCILLQHRLQWTKRRIHLRIFPTIQVVPGSYKKTTTKRQGNSEKEISAFIFKNREKFWKWLYLNCSFFLHDIDEVNIKIYLNSLWLVWSNLLLLSCNKEMCISNIIESPYSQRWINSCFFKMSFTRLATD